MGPLYKFGWFDFLYGLQMAGLIGFCFGFVLERAGFGNPRKFIMIFYLRDFTVLKVMFTAIVVCILGLLYFSVFGWIDLGRVHLLPTFLWPQIAGGLMLGIGFVMGGYCPTVSLIATVSGKLDGLLFVLGMIFGAFVFAEIFPLIEGFYASGAMGKIRLTDVFKINSGVIALLICLIAVGAFWLVERVEQKYGNPEALPKGSAGIKRSAAAVLVLLGLILAVVNPDRVPPRALPMQQETEAASAPVSKSPAKGPAGFKIVKDEGC